MNREKLVNLFHLQDFYILMGLLLTIFFLYFVTAKFIKSSRMLNDQKRRMIANARALFTFLFFLSIFIIWATELYQFVISIAALLVAFVIASKEVLLCVGGSFYKTFAKPFSIGSRIQVDGIRGDVVDIGLLSTQILEVGPKDYTQQLTGRMITFPNSKFLTAEVYNESDSIAEQQDFVLHIIQVPIQLSSDWENQKDNLLECANKSCQEYVEPARQFFSKLAKKRQMDVPLIEPRINIKFSDPEKVLLMLRVCIPVQKRGLIEQEIVRNYLNKRYSEEK